jgi:hypothetical protein
MGGAMGLVREDKEPPAEEIKSASWEAPLASARVGISPVGRPRRGGAGAISRRCRRRPRFMVSTINIKISVEY